MSTWGSKATRSTLVGAQSECDRELRYSGSSSKVAGGAILSVSLLGAAPGEAAAAAQHHPGSAVQRPDEAAELFHVRHAAGYPLMSQLRHHQVHHTPRHEKQHRH